MSEETSEIGLPNPLMTRRQFLKASAAVVVAAAESEGREVLAQHADKLLFVDIPEGKLYEENIGSIFNLPGLEREDQELAREFLSAYYDHGALVVNSANKVRSSLGLSEIGMSQRKMADLTGMITDFDMSEDEQGNKLISARIDVDRFAQAVNQSGQQFAIAAFPFGSSEVKIQKYASYKEVSDRQLYKAIEDPATDEFFYYKSSDNQGREVLAGQRINLEGKLEAYAYVLDENNEQIPQEFISEQEYQDIMGSKVELDAPRVIINEPYSVEKASGSLTEFVNALDKTKAFVVAAGGNINSFSWEDRKWLEQSGYWPEDSLVVGSLIQGEAEGQRFYTSGTDLADIYLDPRDFDTQSSSEACGVFGEILQQMIKARLAQDAQEAKQQLISEYSYRQPFSSRDSSRDYIAILDWEKLKQDLLNPPTPQSYL